MKKTYFFAALLFAAIGTTSISSCSSEETAAQQSKAAVSVEKTDEMLKFENSLKIWMQSKRESGSSQNVTAEVTELIKKDASELLTSLGKNGAEATGKANPNTDELVRAAIREYSKKLTNMYHQQKNN
ncbi:hypothetical protein [Flavobacterium pedocola]